MIWNKPFLPCRHFAAADLLSGNSPAVSLQHLLIKKLPHVKVLPLAAFPPTSRPLEELPAASPASWFPPRSSSPPGSPTCSSHPPGSRGEGWSGGGPGLGTRDTHLPTRLADWQTTQPPFLGSFLGEIRDKERDRASLVATFKTF